jgi:YesN/AraC family two-component response regulator
MEPNETMVENEELDNEADDTLPDEVVEETPDESEDLDSYTESEEQPEEEKPEEQSTSSSEPGWIKKRVEKAVTKAIAETEARMQAMFDRQMAPIRERMMEDEAQELLRSRKVSDIETARELVRLRNGQPAAAQATNDSVEQPRQANGQFAPKNEASIRTEVRIDELKRQADKIKAKSGVDVIAEFNSNPEIKKKVVLGEWDFYDVADYLKDQKPSKRPPSPMRSPNGASGTNPNAIESMTDEQFARMEKRIAEGARIRLSK